MLNFITPKRANGRQLVILLLEPQEIDAIRTGQCATADTSKVEGTDIMIGFVPDGIRFQKLMNAEMPMMDGQKFQRLVNIAQQWPEVKRAVKSSSLDLTRQDVDSPKI